MAFYISLRLSAIMKSNIHKLETLNILKESLLIKSISTKSFLSNEKISNPKGIQDNISSLQLKKRPTRKKKTTDDELESGMYNVSAFATAEEYNLEELLKGLKKQDLYEPQFMKNSEDVIYATAKYQVENQPREIFFFREGGVVLWNINDMESGNLLKFLREYESDSYSCSIVEEESETMSYKNQENVSKSFVENNGNFVVNTSQESTLLDKYTFSNALVLSVKLGVWEASLEKYVDSIEYVTEDLKSGMKIKMSRQEVLRKHGELFALRHLINLSSDLLDTPDFYWENDNLENLYLNVCSYFCINKRTKVMNEKINHCVELIELLSTHLSDRHHTRLEWMVILLILVEVIFEMIHYIDRFVSSEIDYRRR